MIRLWLALLFCPATHRVKECDPFCEIEDLDTSTIASDLIRGGDALGRGWGCDPEVLYNGAERLRALAAQIAESEN